MRNDKLFMKRFYTIIVLLALCATASLAQRVKFTFKDGLYNTQLKNEMETSISSLLSEFNNAYREHRRLRLDGMKLSEKARRSLTFTWDSIAAFTVDSDINSSSCLTCVTGYEVREIYITYHPRKPSEYSGALEREMSIGFAKQPSGGGIITHAHVTLEDDTFGKVMGQGSDVTDMRRRMEILKFVEDFRSYYDEKDINALNQIFSEDALIITGVVMKPAPQADRRVSLRPEIKYNKQTKVQYINSLRGIFARNKYIKVKFEDIEIMAHPYKDNFYGVALKQNWKAMNASGGIRYEDDGYLFLLWEFPENGHPLVHVRTWQPEKTSDGRIMDPQEKFNCNDFFISNGQ